MVAGVLIRLRGARQVTGQRLSRHINTVEQLRTGMMLLYVSAIRVAHQSHVRKPPGVTSVSKQTSLAARCDSIRGRTLMAICLTTAHAGRDNNVNTPTDARTFPGMSDHLHDDH